MPGTTEGGPSAVPRAATLERPAKEEGMALAGSGAMDMQAPLPAHVVKGIEHGPGPHGCPRSSSSARVRVAAGVAPRRAVTSSGEPSSTAHAGRCPSSAGAATPATGVAVIAILSAARAQSILCRREWRMPWTLRE